MVKNEFLAGKIVESPFVMGLHYAFRNHRKSCFFFDYYTGGTKGYIDWPNDKKVEGE